MASISSYLENIMSAVYGEEVRGSIHDAIAAINTESSNMNTQSSSALTEAKRLLEEAQQSLAAFDISLDAVEKAEKSINDKIDKIMTGKIYDDLLDFSGDDVKDSSGNNILGSLVIPNAVDVADLKRSLSAFESICQSFSREYQNHIQSQGSINSDNEKKFSDLFSAKDNLIIGQKITNDLLDSSGSVVLDSSGNNILGSAVIPNQGAVDNIDRRLNAFESDYNSHIKVQSEINLVNEEILSDFVDMKRNLVTGCWFSDNLLDSSGNQIRDSTDRYIEGQTVLAERYMFDDLNSRVAAIESAINTIMKHAVFDSY